MSGARPEPRWHILFTPRWLAWHAFVVAAAAGMLWLGNWQFHRAMSGNPLSWAYTFEWPMFAVFGVVFWIKTIHDELRPAPPPGVASEVDLPAGAGITGGGQAAPAGPGDDDDDDPELAAYNAYLARLNERAEGEARWHGPR